MAPKIGILTYFWQDNPGSFLQALAVLRALERRLPQAHIEFIDCRYERGGFHIAKRYVNPLALLEGWRRYQAYRQCQRQHFPLSERRLVTYRYDEAARFIEHLRYDMIVVGSDTVLEMRRPYKYVGELPIYWLPPSLKCRKVGCAVSSNAQTYDLFPPALRERAAESARGFDLIGVRDDITFGLMQDLGLKDDPRLMRVPDPTFSLDIDYGPIEEYLRTKGIDLSGPAMGVCLPHELGRPVTQHYRRQGMKVVSLNQGPYADFAPWDLSPLAWAGIYRYFDVMITERFHGTIFSLKNGTPVITLEVGVPGHIAPGCVSKRYSLWQSLGMLDTNYVSLDRMRDTEAVCRTADAARAGFDRQAVAEKLRLLRQEFDRFMDKAAGLLA